MPRNTELIEITLVQVASTPAAWGVIEDDDDEDAVVTIWLPKSECTRGEPVRRGSETYTFMVPEWLAIEKGLV